MCYLREVLSIRAGIRAQVRLQTHVLSSLPSKSSCLALCPVCSYFLTHVISTRMYSYFLTHVISTRASCLQILYPWYQIQNGGPVSGKEYSFLI